MGYEKRPCLCPDIDYSTWGSVKVKVYKVVERLKKTMHDVIHASKHQNPIWLHSRSFVNGITYVNDRLKCNGPAYPWIVLNM